MKDKIKYLVYVVIVLFAVILAGAIVFAIKHESPVVENEIKETESDPLAEKNVEENKDTVQEIVEKTETFAIFGVDTRAKNLGKGTRSDSIMVVTVNHESKEIRLASIFRDCYVDIKGNGLDKINHAHSFGGPELAMDTVNRNFDLDIKKYITVNFKNVSELVDDIGGIEMNITKSETRYINSYIDEINKIEGKNSPNITEAGTYTLDGVQAVAYSRIRYTAGGDYKRAERQRSVLFKVFEKAKELDSAELIKLVEKFMKEINTNYQTSDVIDMLYCMSKYNIADSEAFPARLWGGKLNGIYYAVPVTLESTAAELHEYLYPGTEYNVSDTVKDISQKIEQVADTPNIELD